MARLRFNILFLVLFIGGCNFSPQFGREDFSRLLNQICAKKYQCHVICKEVGGSIWVYLPYTTGRRGVGATKERGSELYVEYAINSFNPYRTIDPPELKFLVEKVLKEISRLMLRCRLPYRFFVLVISNIEARDPAGVEDQLYIAYIDDIQDYAVGRSFLGESYNRLVWDRERVEVSEDSLGNKISSAYQDKEGSHINYRDITMKEFIQKQIKWRIYKRFTIEYNTFPFDLTMAEKRAEVLNIIQAVIKAYNFKEFATFSLADSSFMEEAGVPVSSSRNQIENRDLPGIDRKPAF